MVAYNQWVLIWVKMYVSSVLNFRRVTGIVDFGECQSLDADILSSAVYLSPVQTLPPFIYENQEFVLVQSTILSPNLQCSFGWRHSYYYIPLYCRSHPCLITVIYYTPVIFSVISYHTLSFNVKQCTLCQTMSSLITHYTLKS